MKVTARLQTTPSAERQGDDAERCGLSNCQLRWVKSEDSLLINSEKKSGKLVVLLDEFEVVNEAEFYAVYASGNTSPKIKAFVDFFRSKLQEKERKKEVIG